MVISLMAFAFTAAIILTCWYYRCRHYADGYCIYATLMIDADASPIFAFSLSPDVSPLFIFRFSLYFTADAAALFFDYVISLVFLVRFTCLRRLLMIYFFDAIIFSYAIWLWLSAITLIAYCQIFSLVYIAYFQRPYLVIIAAAAIGHASSPHRLMPHLYLIVIDVITDYRFDHHVTPLSPPSLPPPSLLLPSALSRRHWFSFSFSSSFLSLFSYFHISILFYYAIFL